MDRREQSQTRIPGMHVRFFRRCVGPDPTSRRSILVIRADMPGRSQCPGRGTVYSLLVKLRTDGFLRRWQVYLLCWIQLVRDDRAAEIRNSLCRSRRRRQRPTKQ